MSAYIRDFVKCEMCADPDGHWACPLFGSVYPYGYYCGVNRQEIKDPFSQQPWCPVIPVPPHGDLIGRNPLIDIAMHLRNRAKDEYTKRVIGSVIRHIAEAPTIIEAEEG